MQDVKEEVRARLNIEDVIGEYVQLKRAGRNFRGLSPFTSEKTPSFFVSPDRHIWHDFSSNKGGDIFSFIMEVEGMDFRASLEFLARKAGVDLAAYDSKGSQEIAARKKRILQAHDLAANYYQQSLIKNQHALEYVFKIRKLNKQVVRDFRIGYAPTGDNALVKFLTKKGFSSAELSQAGLVNRFGGDLFKGRMMVPLMDSTGQIIGFTGRIIVDDVHAPKYLNTPQTLLYDKSRHVFGLSQAKEAIRSGDCSVIVEGNLDVVSSHQAGIKQVVATAGTAMTEYHLRALVRLSGNIRLAFDGDKAGLAATERAIPIAQGVGVELTIVSLPDSAKDPDELIKQDPTLWQKAIDEAQPALDWLLKQYSLKNDLKTASGKRQFTTAALEIVRLLNDPVEQEYYVSKIAEYSGSSVEVIKEKLANKDFQSTKTYKKVIRRFEPQKDPDFYQDNLLAMAIIDKAVRGLILSVVASTFVSAERQAVAEYLQTDGAAVTDVIPKQLQKYEEYVKMLLLRADVRYADWSNADRYSEAARLIRQVANEYRKKQKEMLIEQLRDVESVGDDVKADEIRSQLNKLIKEI